jgi:siroheme synthase
MFGKILQMLSIACKHKNISQPFAAVTFSRSKSKEVDWEPVVSSGKHYVVCLDCGKQFNYDWNKMRIVS